MSDAASGGYGRDIRVNRVSRMLSLYAVEAQVTPVLKPGSTRFHGQGRLKGPDFDIRNLSDG